MVDLTPIKNQYLRELISQSQRFVMLSPEEQKAQVEKISLQSEETIEEKYIPFFEEGNNQEMENLKNNSDKLRELVIKIQEANNVIRQIQLSSMDEASHKDDLQKADDLLNEINNIN